MDLIKKNEKKKCDHVFVVALFLTCIICFPGCKKESAGNISTVDDSHLVTNQKIDTRIVEGNVEEFYPYRFVYSDSVALNPHDIAVSNNGVLVLDLPNRVAVIDSSGDFAGHLGGVNGNGPGEFSFPVSVSWTSEGSAVIADHGNQRVMQYGLDGSLESETSFPRGFADFGFMDDTRFVSHSVLDSVLFRTFEMIDGNVSPLKDFGWLTSNTSPLASMSTGGRFTIIPQTETFAFAPLNAGRLAKFDWNGNQVFYIKTIDDAPYYDLVVNPNGSAMMTQENLHGVANTIVSADAEIIYIFRFALTEEMNDAGNYIDKYSTEDGSYLSSIHLPVEENQVSCSPMYVDAQVIWQHCDGNLVRLSAN